MDRRSIRQLALWIALGFIGQVSYYPIGLCASHETTGRLSETLHIQVGEFHRTYQLHLPPSYDGAAPLPLVFVFHGRFENAQDIAEITGFSDIADRQGFIVVYPIGIHRHWNDGRVATPIFGAGNYDDVGFIEALIHHLQATLTIDPTRIYATGMSNGGMFVQRLACELDGVFAAVAPVSGTLPVQIAPHCAPKEPVSVIEFHGIKDAYVSWDGGLVRALGGKTLSVSNTIDHWRRLEGCPSSAHVAYAPHPDPREGTRARRDTYGPCRDGSDVVLYTIEGGGHTWPGGPEDDSLPFLGQVTRDVSATQTIWAFFEQHPKPMATKVGTLRTQQPLQVRQHPVDSHIPSSPMANPSVQPRQRPAHQFLWDIPGFSFGRFLWTTVWDLPSLLMPGQSPEE